MPRIRVRFAAVLFRIPGKGGWTFAPVPPRKAPPVQARWGRTSVMATVDGYTWKTSVWREQSGRTLLPIPQAARGDRGEGDRVTIELEFSA